MKKNNERGFSLIELLIVVVVIGVIAAIAVPHLRRAVLAAENGNMFATMRSVFSTEMSFLTQNSRFARLNEVNNILADGIGTQSGNDLVRGKFVISMTPPVPTDAELRDGFLITATRNITGEGTIYQYELTQTGEIRQILPAQ